MWLSTTFNKHLSGSYHNYLNSMDNAAELTPTWRYIIVTIIKQCKAVSVIVLSWKYCPQFRRPFERPPRKSARSSLQLINLINQSPTVTQLTPAPLPSVNHAPEVT